MYYIEAYVKSLHDKFCKQLGMTRQQWNLSLYSRRLFHFVFFNRIHATYIAIKKSTFRPPPPPHLKGCSVCPSNSKRNTYPCPHQEFLLRSAKMIGAHYPERSYKIFILNAPWWFSLVWKVGRLSTMYRRLRCKLLTVGGVYWGFRLRYTHPLTMYVNCADDGRWVWSGLALAYKSPRCRSISNGFFIHLLALHKELKKKCVSTRVGGETWSELFPFWTFFFFPTHFSRELV